MTLASCTEERVKEFINGRDGQAKMERATAHVSAACSEVRKARTVRGAFRSLRLFTKTYAFRFSLTAFFTSSTVSRRISCSSSTIFVYGSARFFSAS